MLAGPALASPVLAWGDEGDVAPPIDPDAYLPLASETSCLAAIRAALDATGEFDAVWFGLDRDPIGRPSDDLLAIHVEPGRVATSTLGDDGPGGLMLLDATATLRVVVRMDDPELRDATLARLTTVARNALNARKLARYCWPDWTRVSAWTTLPARDAERSTAASLSYRWHEDGWASADTS